MQLYLESNRFITIYSCHAMSSMVIIQNINEQISKCIKNEKVSNFLVLALTPLQAFMKCIIISSFCY